MFTKLNKYMSLLTHLKKKKLHYTRRITSRSVTSAEAHLRDLAPEQHSSEETSQRWRVVGDTGFDSTRQGIERKTLRNNSGVLSKCANRAVGNKRKLNK